jgi:nucleoside-diphosphate-sugar epimerase
VNALIGHTGFIGRNLTRQRPWSECYNRGNIDAIRGRHFDQVVCAGLPSDRWLANGNPGGDRTNMLSLATALGEVSADRFVLISTIDVYPVQLGVDETTPFEAPRSQAYGEHRLEFERIVAGQFPRCHIVRLPAAFGPEARRNVLVDLIRRRDLDAIDPRATYQWYPVSRLADDIDRVVERDVSLVNLCSEPLECARVHQAYFDDLRIGGRPGPAVRQDVRTRHGRLFGT